MDLSIFSSFLARGLLFHYDRIDFKELEDLHTKQNCFYIYWDEKNILPKDYNSYEFESKGCYERTIIQDFPLSEKAVYLSIRRRRWRNKIDKIIATIDDGTYGYCVDTGEEIGLPRLEGRPMAERTVDAQERWEHKKKQLGDW